MARGLKVSSDRTGLVLKMSLDFLWRSVLESDLAQTGAGLQYPLSSLDVAQNTRLKKLKPKWASKSVKDLWLGTFSLEDLVES